MNVGDRVKARVTRIEEFGLFAKFDGHGILVLITDWSWDCSLCHGDVNLGAEIGV